LLIAVFVVQQAKKKAANKPQQAGSLVPESLPSEASVRDGQPPTLADTSPLSESPLERSPSAPIAYLQHWEQNVRDHVCQGNSEIEATMCLQAVVRTLLNMRREWKSMKLIAVEMKHSAIATNFAYPEGFPVRSLVRYIIPNCQLE
jgi:hypothetical protein